MSERRLKQLEAQIRAVTSELQKVSNIATRAQVGPVLTDKNNPAQQFHVRVVNGSLVAEEIE